MLICESALPSRKSVLFTGKKAATISLPETGGRRLMHMKRVMVVDENALVRQTVKYYLCKRGYDVSLCGSHHGVLDNVKEYNPDIILIDLNISGLCVQELVELTDKAKAECGCKLIVFSSEDESTQAELVEKGHADGYFKKMHSLEGLDNKIKELYVNTDKPDEFYP